MPQSRFDDSLHHKKRQMRLRKFTCGAFGIVAIFLVILSLTYAWTYRVKRAEIQPQQVAFRLDINATDEGLLSALPGIGPSLAGNIASYREHHGLFTETEQLKNVHMIGPRTLKRIAPYITLEAHSSP